VVQAVQYLLCKWEALSSNLVPPKRKEGRNRRREEESRKYM
jgi:hypothetical protein